MLDTVVSVLVQIFCDQMGLFMQDRLYSEARDACYVVLV